MLCTSIPGQVPCTVCANLTGNKPDFDSVFSGCIVGKVAYQLAGMVSGNIALLYDFLHQFYTKYFHLSGI